MSTRLDLEKEELKNFMQECVNAGLTVYWHKELTEEEKKHSYNVMYHRRWFYVTNGKNVLYVGINSYGNLDCSFQYIPNRENGTGCGLLERDSDILTVDKVKKFLNIENVHQLAFYCRTLNKDYINFYKDENDWFNRKYDKDRYEIIKKG